jgi:hypothetical protein
MKKRPIEHAVGDRPIEAIYAEPTGSRKLKGDVSLAS